jgi:S1-C subfamily serine protease
MTAPHPLPPRPPVAPLLLAGAALAITVWLLFDRVRPTPVHVPAAPRAIEPRGALADFEQATVAIFEQSAPSVVHITSRAIQPVRTMFGVRQSLQEGTGTGFVWDERGYIITNWHVVQSERSDLVVRFQGLREAPALVVGGAPNLDIAVVKVASLPAGVRPLPIGTSQGLRVGQAVFAIGNPFGLDQTLTTGVVSALDREIQSEQGTPIQGVIQVDAAINPGNSGGPLLDSAGRLIGMNTAIVSPSRASAGIGFAIPVDTINRTVPRLIQGDLGRRPALGVRTQVVRLPDGAVHPLVTAVEPGSGAEEAGLLGVRGETYGDLIVAIDGSAVHSFEDLITILDQKQLGQTVQVKVLRHHGGEDFREVELTVPLRTEVQRQKN